jgi:hypothetical protein
MKLRHPSGKSITDWRDWERPKKSYQWAPGRSAMELARAWFTSSTPTVPPELSELLASHPLTRKLTLSDGTPEFVTGLPERGEGRNHDLVLHGQADRPVTLCVEAKADEPFDKLVSEVWAESTDAAGQPVGKSRKAQRLQALLTLLFGPDAKPTTAPWSEIRYQLLTAAAGTVIQASRDGAPIGVMVVHEFLTEKVDRVENVPRNAADFALFTATLARVPREKVRSGALYGPVKFPRGQYLAREVQLLIGKAVFDWSVGREA